MYSEKDNFSDSFFHHIFESKIVEFLVIYEK